MNEGANEKERTLRPALFVHGGEPEPTTVQFEIT
jgi:hypothetical protein